MPIQEDRSVRVTTERLISGHISDKVDADMQYEATQKFQDYLRTSDEVSLPYVQTYLQSAPPEQAEGVFHLLHLGLNNHIKAGRKDQIEEAYYQRLLPAMKAFSEHQKKLGRGKPFQNLENKLNRDRTREFIERERNYHLPLFRGDEMESMKGMSDEARRKMAIAGFIAESQGLDFNGVIDNYEVFIAQMGSNLGVEGESAVYANIKETLEKREEKRLLDEEITERAFESVLFGMNHDDAQGYMRDNVASLDEKDSPSNNTKLRRARQVFAMEHGDKMKIASSLVSQIASKQGVKTDISWADDDKSAIHKLFHLPREERQKAIGMMGLIAERYSDSNDGVGEGMAISFERGLDNMKENLGFSIDKLVHIAGETPAEKGFREKVEKYGITDRESFVEKVKELKQKHGVSYYDFLAGRRLSTSNPEWHKVQTMYAEMQQVEPVFFRDSVRETIQDMRMIRDLVKKVKTDSSNWIPDNVEQGLYDASNSAPYMMAFASGTGGALVGYAHLSEENEIQLRKQYPDMPEHLRNRVAYTAGVLEAGIERLQIKTLFKGAPKTSALFKKMGLNGGIATLLGRGVSITAKEYLQERVQDTMLPLVQDIAGVLSEDIPDVTAEEWAHHLRVWDERTFFAVLPLSVLGAGGSTALDKIGAESFRKHLSGEDKLRLAGLTKEEAQKVAGLKGIKAHNTFIDMFQAKTVEERKANHDEAVADGAVDRVLEEDATPEEKKQLQAMRELREIEGRYKSQINEREEGDFEVVYPESFNMPNDYFKSKDEAEQAIVEAHEVADVRSTESIVDTEAHISAMRGFAEHIEQTHEGASVRFNKQSMTAQKAVEQGKASFDQIEERLRIASQESGAEVTLDNAIVKGSAELRKNAQGYIARIYKDGDIATVFEEASEGYMRNLVEHGVKDIDFFKQHLAEYQRNTGDILAQDVDAFTDQEAIEGFSKLARAYVYNEQNHDALPTGLRGILETFKQFFKTVLETASNLIQLKKDGKLDGEFEQYLANSVGLNEEMLLEQERKRYEKELLEEAYDPDTELSVVMKGRIPRPADLKEGETLKGEVQRIWDNLTYVNRKGHKQAQKASNFFAPKGTDLTLSDSLEHAQEEGFDFDTEAEMLEAVEESLAGNKQFPSLELLESGLTTFSVQGFVNEIHSHTSAINQARNKIEDIEQDADMEGYPSVEDHPEYHEAYEELEDAYWDSRLDIESHLKDFFEDSEWEVESVNAGSTSFYFEVSLKESYEIEEEHPDIWESIEENASFKIRFSDHANESRLHDYADVNIQYWLTKDAISKQFENMFRRMAKTQNAIPASLIQSDKQTSKMARLVTSLDREKQDSGLESTSFSIEARQDPVISKINSMMRDPEMRYNLLKVMHNKVRAVKQKQETAMLKRQLTGEKVTSRDELLDSLALLEAVIHTLPIEIRGKVKGGYKALAKYKTARGLENYILRRLERVDKVLDKYVRDTLKKDILKVLDRSEPSIGQNRRRKGKIDWIGHEVASYAKNVTTMLPEDAQAEADKLRLEMDDLDIKDKKKLRKELEAYDAKIVALELMYDLKHADAERLQRAYEFIFSNYQEGRKQWINELMERKYVRETRVARLLKHIGGDGRSKVAQGKAVATAKSKSNALNEGMIQLVGGGHHHLGRIFENSKNKKQAQTFYNQILDERLKAEIGGEKDREAMQSEFFGALAGMLGKEGSLKNHYAREFLYNAKKEVEDHGITVERMDGEEFTGVRENYGAVSQGEALNLWLTMRQTDQFEKLEQMGYDSQTMQELEAFLTDDMKAVGLWMVGRLKQFGQSLNETHRAEYGISLPQHENYFPVRNQVVSNRPEIDPNDRNTGRAMSAGALKDRVANNAEPMRIDAFSVFFSHVAEMTYWQNNVKWLREWGGVMRNKEFAQAMRVHVGEKAYRNVGVYLQGVQNQGIANGQLTLDAEHVVKKLNRRFALSILGARMSTIWVNASSFMNAFASPEVSNRKLMKNMVKMFFNPNGEIKATWRNELQQLRRDYGASFEASIAMERSSANTKTWIQDAEALAQKGLTPMNYADVGMGTLTTAVIYKTKYEEAIELGMSQEQAKAEANNAVTRSVATLHQPTLQTSRSFLEQKVSSNPLTGLFSMFRSETRKNAGNAYMAWRTLITGKGMVDRATAGRQAFVLSFVYPAMVVGMREILNAISKDEDDDEFWERVTDWRYWTYNLVGDFLRAVPALGDAGMALLSKPLDQKYYPSSTPFERIAVEAMTIDELWDEKKTPSERIDAFLDKADIIGMLPAGAVVAEGANVVEFVKNVAENGFGYRLTKEDAIKSITDDALKINKKLYDETLPSIKGDNLTKEQKRENKKIKKERWVRLAELYLELKERYPDHWEEVKKQLIEKNKLPKEVQKLMKKKD